MYWAKPGLRTLEFRNDIPGMLAAAGAIAIVILKREKATLLMSKSVAE